MHNSQFIIIHSSFFALLKIFATLGNLSKFNCSRLSQKFLIPHSSFLTDYINIFVFALHFVFFAGEFL